MKPTGTTHQKMSMLPVWCARALHHAVLDHLIASQCVALKHGLMQSCNVLLRLALLCKVVRSPASCWAPPEVPPVYPLWLLRRDSDRRRPDADWRSLKAPPEKQPAPAAPVRQKGIEVFVICMFCVCNHICETYRYRALQCLLYL